MSAFVLAWPPIPHPPSGDSVKSTHPIHLHLDAFQVLDRQPATIDRPADGITTRDTTATVRIGHAPEDSISHELDDNELGLKDTVRVNPNEVVDIVVRLSSAGGTCTTAISSSTKTTT
jgi:FtsP/CotA-like multicopper oxidase with cupredoxin domain